MRTHALTCLAATAAVGLGLAALDAGRAHACSKRHQTLFELFDEAGTVAVARVVAAPGRNQAGKVTLAVKTRIKGKQGRLTVRETNTSCHVGFRTGRTALVFVRADGWPAGHYEGYVEKPSPAMVSTMRAWAAAATPAERVAVLVAAAAGPDATVAHDAATYLADDPALLAVLDAAALTTLAAAAPSVRDHRVELVLARVHGKQWRAMVTGKKIPAGLEFDALAHHDFEAETSAGRLADLIDAARGEESPERIAAFERCERLHGHRLARFAVYGNGVSSEYWHTLADACRSGTPAP